LSLREVAAVMEACRPVKEEGRHDQNAAAPQETKGARRREREWREGEVEDVWRGARVDGQ
jgi:hypothetical protein